MSDVRSQEVTRQFFVNNVVFTECLPKIRDQLPQVSVVNCLLRHGATLSINETQLLTVYDNVTALIHLRSMGGPDIGSHLMYMAIRENTTEHNEAVRLLEETGITFVRMYTFCYNPKYINIIMTIKDEYFVC